MIETDRPKANLPDVSVPEPSLNYGSVLPWVGMREIEVPVKVKLPKRSASAAENDAEKTEHLLIAGRLDLGVSLDRKDARGIHMSRLFRLAMEALPQFDLTLELLAKLADDSLKTHEGLSSSVKLALKFNLPLAREALKSHGQGWRNYPVMIRFEKIANAGASIEKAMLEVDVLYSSTCPASAALSRQINEEAGLQHFTGDEIRREDLKQWLHSAASLSATPHAQRSRATVRVELRPVEWGRDLVELLASLVTRLEDALGTPVQTLVKREDEQEFARRNAENLMFCEDAARRLSRVLETSPEFLGFEGEVAHFESLHPHDAVAVFAGRNE